ALLVPARNRRSKVGRITGKSAEDERVAAGSGVAMKRSNVRGAKGPCHLQCLQRKEGKDEMTKASIDLQDLRRRLYVKAKAEPSWRFLGAIRPRLQDGDPARGVCDGQTKRWGPGNRRGHVRGHRGARRGGSARAAARRTDRVHLQATPSPEAGDTERRGQSPRLVDPGDPGQSGAGCAQAHPRTCVRGGLPTGVVWISAQADSTRRDQASGGSNSSAEDAGPRL